MPARRTGSILLTSLLWAVACTAPAGDAPTGTRLVVLGPAVVRDPRTGLEWTRRDDGSGLDWYGAEAYCLTLPIDAGRWRLPEIEELRSLYGAATSIPCGDARCAIDPSFTLTSPYVWSATSPGPTARTYLDFKTGHRFSPSIRPSLVRSVLCVRASSSPVAGTV